MNLITFLIKGLGIPGYNPAEDIIEGGIDFLSNHLEDYRESIKVRLKNENFTDDQIKAIKKILAESNSRFITNTPTFIGDKNADSMKISRTIFDDFKKVNGTNSDLAIYLEDYEQSEKIIKGISIVITPVISSQVLTVEYATYLTRKLKETNKKATDNKNVLDNHGIQLADHSNRIKNLEQAETQSSGSLESKINEYQEYVYRLYEKRYIGNTLLGEESLAELYMQPSYYKSEDETGDVEQLFDEFISNENHGVFWIVGEPGHGKTSMCIKAVADYRSKKRYQQARGVFWFRLNPQGTTGMVNPKTLVLEKVFSWGRITGNRSYMIEPDEIEGSLVFLDGFDELKSSLEEYGISNDQFYEQVNQLAQEYQMHIVITSRTRALEQGGFIKEYQLRRGPFEITCNLSDGGVLKNNVMLLSPLTGEKQTAWINELISFRESKGIDTSDLGNYKHTFKALQGNEDIAVLLKVPILLRMIVQNCFEPSSGNRVELYRELYDKTLLRQGLGDQRERLHSIYQEIAFRIFVYDDDFTELNKGELKEINYNNAYLYQYYLHTPEVESGQDKADIYRITFLHRSFYQYFLSEFFYEKLKSVTNGQGGQNFLKYLWPRHIDPYVLVNLRLRAKNECIDYMQVFWAIDKTDAFFSEYKNSSGSKESIGIYDKANNVFWNAISACNSIFQVEASQKKMGLTGRVIELLSKYTCSEILLRNSFLSDANLSRADLGGANLSGADLCGADLSEADLRRADLREAQMRGANLSSACLGGAHLSGTDLNKAHLIGTNLGGAQMCGANLREAYLHGADLTKANLSGADLCGAHLRGADLTKADLRGANLRGAELVRANLSEADLSGAHLRGAELSGADLRGAHLSGADLVRANLSEADLRGAHLSGADLVRVDLRGADLRKDYLSGAHLRGAHLRGAYLIGADLSRAYLSEADLSEAVLCKADLRKADLRGAYLIGADLRKADLREANLSGAFLRETDLNGADLSGADLSGAILDRTKLPEN